MQKLPNRCGALLMLAVFLLASVQSFGATSRRENKTTKKQASSRVKSQSATTTESTNPDVDEAQALLTNGISRLTASLECNC